MDTNMTLTEMFKELFGLNKKDERIAAAANKAYAVGFIILTVGILIDFVYGIIKYQIAVFSFPDLDINMMDYYHPLEFITLMVAMIVVSVIAARSGFAETGKMAEVEKFPAKYYLFVSIFICLLTTVSLGLLRCFAEFEILGFADINWFANFAIGFIFGATIGLVCYPVFYLNYVWARNAREKKLAALEDE